MFSSIRIAAIMSIGMFFVVPVALAQGTNPTGPAPTQADFDVCNKQAEAQAGSPSAAAKPRTGPMITGPVTPETGAQGGPAPSSPGASTPSTTTPGAAGEKPQNAGGAQVVRPDAEGAQTTGSANAGNPTKDVRITGSD